MVENNQSENLIAGPSKSPSVQPENLEEVKTSFGKEIMSNLAKMMAENQKEMMKLIVPMTDKKSVHQNIQDSDSETENICAARMSTPVKTNTATTKTTPINSRNMVTGVLNYSTNQPTKRPKQQPAHSEQTRDRPTTTRLLFAPQPETFQSNNILPMPKALLASLPNFDNKSEKN